MPSIALGIQPGSWLMPDRQANKNMGNFREKEGTVKRKKNSKKYHLYEIKVAALAKMRACLLFDGEGSGLQYHIILVTLKIHLLLLCMTLDING